MREIWDFAVEIEILLTEGLTKSDLRWLVSKGYVEHAEESTQSRDGSRTFRPCLNLAFSDRTCFVLTEAGDSLKAEASCFVGDVQPLVARCASPRRPASSRARRAIVGRPAARASPGQPAGQTVQGAIGQPGSHLGGF